MELADEKDLSSLIDSPFEIVIPSHLSSEQVPQCFLYIYNLFSESTQIKITYSELFIYEFLSEKLDNRSLSSSCNDVSPTCFTTFRLSFLRFKEIPAKTLNSMNDFTLFVNQTSFSCISAYASCISDLIFKQVQLNNQNSAIKFSVSNELVFLLKQVLNLLRGNSIKIPESEINQMIEVSNILHFDNIKKFIFKQLPAPQSFEESIKFIKQSTQFAYQKHLNQAISIVVKQFKKIDFSVLRDLPLSFLIQIISSKAFLIQNETYLFTTIK
jgi:hypothetical protein